MATKITGTVGGDPLIEVEIGGVFVPWKQGIQNWASVTAVTGSPTTGTYTDGDGVEWTYWKWTSSGSVTTTAGIVDCLIISGGSGSSTSNAIWYYGSAGHVRDGIRAVANGTKTIVVGAAGTNTGGATQMGGYSAIGSIEAGGYLTGLAGSRGKDSTDTSSYGAGGIVSSITGTPTEYAYKVRQTTSPIADGPYGKGGDDGNSAQTAGVVIFRVPAAFDLT